MSHTLRSGRSFKASSSQIMSEESVAELKNALDEERRQREADWARLEEERKSREREFELERHKREEERAKEKAFYEEEIRRGADERLIEQRRQDEQVTGWLKKILNEVPRDRPRENEGPKLAKLTDSDDIEAFLTTFERIMQAFEVAKKRWSYKLAPQLSGKAQQAYAAMERHKADDYEEVKKAILQRYNITEETYRQRFRSARRSEGETYQNLAFRLSDMAQKWTKECGTIEQLLDKMVMEQLLKSLPEETRIWVHERKPSTSDEASQWADDHGQARRSMLGQGNGQRGSSRYGSGHGKVCFKCNREGHLARDCRSKDAKNDKVRSDKEDTQTEKTEDRSEPLSHGGGNTGGSNTPGFKNKFIRCYNCQQKGHVAAKCPSKALCGVRQEQGSQEERTRRLLPEERAGKVEGTEVPNILLDTGCSTTLIRNNLVPTGKLLQEWIEITCAHGDTKKYQLAEISVEVDGKTHVLKAGVTDTLPRPMLLGTDFPELFTLLKSRKNESRKVEQVEAVCVMTRAQKKQKETEERHREQEDRESGASTNPVASVPTAIHEERGQEKKAVTQANDGEEATIDENPGSGFDDDLFGRYRPRRTMTRQEKRSERRAFGEKQEWDLDWNADDLKKMQQEDNSLEEARRKADRDSEFLWKDGLLYREGKWKLAGDLQVTLQLVLPQRCRKAVIRLAHEVPLAGHLGRKKMTDRILQRFYWPNVRRDVAAHCKSCENCQKAKSRKVKSVPLIPLPVIVEPFRRIAMDIVGPLPRSRTGHKYILVVCDYATRYPEAIPLKSIHASHVADELVTLISRVGIPEEILTDQGSNFTSQLLAELYRLLNIKGIRTSPYHPQTDGVVERFNQTLKSMIRKFVKAEGKDWDMLLPYGVPFVSKYKTDDIYKNAWCLRKSPGITMLFM